ncbi:MAG: hypothetical protein KGJ80_18550 [Chloroflexota bacterium]|nr:hypothetical protein [Chloroflexota bacterium]
MKLLYAVKYSEVNNREGHVGHESSPCFTIAEACSDNVTKRECQGRKKGCIKPSESQDPDGVD